ncbi:MAG: peptide chain release factor N(5)-glutamine methyltransferase [Burkholderiaceae bacterium]
MRTLLSACELPALEARALLARELGVPREQLIARPETHVGSTAAASFLKMAKRRHRGEPLAYLLGEKEFYGRSFVVSPAVLIPRPETERVVDVVLRRLPQQKATVLELGTGSGCIAITLALERLQWQLMATDVSADAIDVARSSAERWQTTDVSLSQGNWFDAVPRGARFDLIVSNPPYVALGDPHLDQLRFEPPLALTADEQGFASLRSIIEGAPSHLVAGGTLVLEHGHTQGGAVRDLFAARGWHDVQTDTDLAQLDRVTSARCAAV